MRSFFPLIAVRPEKKSSHPQPKGRILGPLPTVAALGPLANFCRIWRSVCLGHWVCAEVLMPQIRFYLKKGAQKSGSAVKRRTAQKFQTRQHHDALFLFLGQASIFTIFCCFERRTKGKGHRPVGRRAMRARDRPPRVRHRLRRVARREKRLTRAPRESAQAVQVYPFPLKREKKRSLFFSCGPIERQKKAGTERKGQGLLTFAARNTQKVKKRRCRF